MRDDISWIQTYTGKKFWPLDPDPDDVCIEDIAHALSMKCRFTGHCHTFYSVAQHSVMVHDIVTEKSKRLRKAALLHDAAEAYFADVATPVKRAHDIFKEIEDKILLAIATKFGFLMEDIPVIKYADTIAFLTERRDIMGVPPRPYTPRTLAPMEVKIKPELLPATAKRIFLSRYEYLT